MSPPDLHYYPGLTPYLDCWQAMQAYTAQRDADTPDALWVLQHPPVYTQGVGGKSAHVLDSGTIPVLQIDRGGQVTYHGPGQWVVYVLLDLQRRQWTIRHLVNALEQAVIDLLGAHGVLGERREGAPGVYVAEGKIAALGLRVRRGCSYHGLSLNVDMDLSPFQGINPCGYPGLAVTQLRDVGIALDLEQSRQHLLTHLLRRLTD